MFLPSPSSQAELCTCPASEGCVALRDPLLRHLGMET